MAKKYGLLFILGAPKTATSTLCALLNSHPEIFIMYEVELNNYRYGKYAKQLVANYPETAAFFNINTPQNPMRGYRKAADYFIKNGHNKEYFGDKIADLTCNYHQEFNDTKIIYCARYLPEWLAKSSTRKLYALDNNIVPTAVQFTKHLVESFLLTDVFFIRMRDLIEKKSALLHEVESFLRLKGNSFPSQWWQDIGKYRKDSAKNCLTWWPGHLSSTLEPEKKDTLVEINADCEFWPAILPVFEKYFFATEKYNKGLKKFTKKEIEKDLEYLNTLTTKFSVGINEAYNKINSENLVESNQSLTKKFQHIFKRKNA